MSSILTLSAYLEQRGKKAKALKKGEAEAFGIPYPLQAGWPWRYGAMEITPAMVEDAQARIRAARQKAKERVHTVPQSSVSPSARLSSVPGFVLRRPKRYRSRSSAPWT